MACMRRPTVRTHRWRMYCYNRTQQRSTCATAARGPMAVCIRSVRLLSTLRKLRLLIGQESWFIIDRLEIGFQSVWFRCFSRHTPSCRFRPIVRHACDTAHWTMPFKWFIIGPSGGGVGSIRSLIFWLKFVKRKMIMFLSSIFLWRIEYDLWTSIKLFRIQFLIRLDFQTRTSD